MRSHGPEAAIPVTDTSPTPRLRGHLGVRDLVFTVLAYNAPLAIMAGYIPLVIGYGNGVGAPATFAVIGLLLCVFAVGLTAMSHYMRSPGAFYSYITAGIGKPAGLGGAFTAFAGYTAIAISGYAFAGYFFHGSVAPLINAPDLDWWIWSLVMWAACSSLSLFQIDVSAKVLGVAIIAEIVMVVIWDIKVFFDGGPDGIVTSSFSYDSFTTGSVSFALLFGVLCITGFEAVAVFRAETRDPARTVPRATYLSVVTLAGFYCISSIAFLTAFGTGQAAPAAAADPTGSWIASVDTYVGTAAVDVVTVLLVSSGFAAQLATQNISARYLFALGQDGVISRRFAWVHPRFGSPFVAAASVACITLVGFLTAAVLGVEPLVFFPRLAGFGGVCLLTLMTATAAAVFLYFRRNPDHPAGPFQAIITPVLAFAGLGTILFLAVKNMGVIIGSTPGDGKVATAIVALVFLVGIVAALALRSARPDVYARIGSQDL